MATQEWDNLMETLRKREADPAWQERQRQDAAKLRREEALALARARADALEDAKVPLRYRALMRSGAVTETEAVKAVKGGSIEIVLSGGVGTGKTVAASWWVWDWLSQAENWAVSPWGTPKLRGSVLFVTAARLSRWARYSERDMEVLLGASRLVVDDLGVEYLDEKGAYLALLDELVDSRHTNQLPTVFTTNLKMDPFCERYGDRLIDRLNEGGRFVSLGDESLRRSA